MSRFLATIIVFSFTMVVQWSIRKIMSNFIRVTESIFFTNYFDHYAEKSSFIVYYYIRSIACIFILEIIFFTGFKQKLHKKQNKSVAFMYHWVYNNFISFCWCETKLFLFYRWTFTPLNWVAAFKWKCAFFFVFFSIIFPCTQSFLKIFFLSFYQNCLMRNGY